MHVMPENIERKDHVFFPDEWPAIPFFSFLPDFWGCVGAIRASRCHALCRIGSSSSFRLKDLTGVHA